MKYLKSINESPSSSKVIKGAIKREINAFLKMPEKFPFTAFENYVESICDVYKIRDFKANKNYTVDISDSVNLCDKKLDELPFRFGVVDGYFNISENNLTSLYGSPTYTSGSFNCAYNNLKSLEFVPKRVGGNLMISGNYDIKSFEYIPSHIGGDFTCGESQLYTIWSLFEDKSKIELFNDYDIIQGDSIILERLNDFLKEIGKPLFYGYKCI